MRISMLILTAILAASAVPAQAQTVIDIEDQKAASPQVQDQAQASAAQARLEAHERSAAGFTSRYSFNRVENGFLRLDNENGQVAYCSSHAVGWACQAVPIDRARWRPRRASAAEVRY